MRIDLKELARAEQEWAVVTEPDGDGATTMDRDGHRVRWSDAGAAFAATESDDDRERAHALVCAQWFIDSVAGAAHRSSRPRPVPTHPVPKPPKKLKVNRRACLCHSANGGRKRTHPTRDAANAAALAMSAKGGATMNAFECPGGTGFHVATSVADKRARAALAVPRHERGGHR
ncbi:hypothetical protein [Demequina rhizosphaerae]|uniref:hypothetical protein n=1 Tax=Demequina rhizosphaerae TaxID=1638985 RepID=UPI000B0A5774|nr:hypothetical protein [Demequina rhizosphaerae]